MKEKLSGSFLRMLFSIVLWISGLSSILIAQTWTSIDGGGPNGISTATSLNSDYPSVAILNGAVYAIWQENTGTAYEVHVKKYDGTNWVTAGNSAGSSLLYSCTYSLMYPKLVYYNNALYAAWSGFDAGIWVVHVKKYDGSSWSFTQDYMVGEGRTNINNGITANAMKIDLCVYNNELYATWVEQDHLGGGFYNVRISKFNGSIWTSVDGNGNYGINYNTMVSASYPTLCVFNNALYAAWTESNISAVQVRVRRYDGSNTWTFVDGNGVDGLNYSTTTTPYDVPFSLSSYSGKMYAFWTENNKLRVKRYDETNGWTTDIDGGNGWNHNSALGAYCPNSIIYNNLMYVAWEQNPVPRQVRVVSFDGTTKTFIDGNVAAIGINNTTANRGHFPKLLGYKGDLMAVWSEELTSTSGSANQIRAKKYSLPPFVESVSVPANGTYITGQTLNFAVNYSKDVVISGGTPYIPITLNTGGTVNATYTGGSGTNTLTYSYTIASGNVDMDGISVGSTISNGGATLQSEDAAPLSANLTLNNVGSTTGVLVDAAGPTVTSVSSITADGYYNAGDVIIITISCSEAALVTGTPSLALNSGGTASYASGSGTAVLRFNYTVASGQNSADLDYSATNALSLSGGTLRDGNSNNASLTLPTVGGLNSLGGQKNIVIDNTAPSVTITSPASDPTNATIPVTITFSEPVTGFDVSDITVTNGLAGSFSTVNAYTYNATISPAGIGTVTANIVGSVATDAAGNNNTAATALSRVFDNIAPAAPTISGVSSGSYNSDQIFTVSGEAGATLEYSTNNGGLWIAYSGAVILSAEGTYQVLARQTDLAGNGPTASGTITLMIDKSAPAAPSIFGISSGSYNSNQAFTVSGEAGAILEYSTNNGGLWIAYSGAVILSAEGTYLVLARQTDLAGNGPTSSGVITLIIDNVSPTVNVSSTIGDPTNATPIPVSITFSEPVAGFEVSDITVGNATASNLQTSDNVSWTADISPIGMGAFSVEIYAGVAQDLAGNNNTASIYFQRTYDPVAPTVVLSSTSTDPTNDHPIVVSIAFSETVFNLELSDIVVGNGTASNLQMLDYYQHWTVDIDPASNGIVTVDIPVGAAQDYATNNNIAAVQLSRTYVNLAPTVTTEAVTGIGTTTATGNGTITDLGSSNPTAYGVCWNTTGAPTLSDSSVDNGTAAAVGAFVAPMNSLSDNTTYYVRAYAINAADTSYGGEVSFTTIAQWPSIAFTLTSSGDLESVSSALLQVDLSSASGLPVTVDYTVSGTATGSGTDYTLDNGTLTISAGAASNNITITSIVDDLHDEGDETIIITLSNPVNATLGSNTVHTYTITDNDNTTGFSDLTKVHLSVYPNPFTNNIHINNRDNDISYIVISDLSGKIVLKTDLKGEKDINVNQLISGVYLLTLVKTNDEIQMIKVVKN